MHNLIYLLIAISFILPNRTLSQTNNKKVNIEIVGTFDNKYIAPLLIDANNLLDSLLLKLDSLEAKKYSENISTRQNYLLRLLMLHLELNKEKQYIASSGPLVGSSNIDDTSTINKYLIMPEIQKIFPKNNKFNWFFKEISSSSIIQLFAIDNSESKIKFYSGIILEINKSNNSINLSLDKESSERLKQLSKNNKNKYLAVTLDNSVCSYFIVKKEIKNGKIKIKCDMRQKEAQRLLEILEEYR